MKKYDLLDEAQDMRLEVLAILRDLTNFEMDSRLVLSVVLAGDARLEKLLRRQEVEPVRRRLVHVATLRLLSRDETRSYMEHRITIAGGKQLPFDHDAVDAVYEITRGNLRAIDHVAHSTWNPSQIRRPAPSLPLHASWAGEELMLAKSSKPNTSRSTRRTVTKHQPS